jgi:ubiquitin-protein ligase
MEDFEYYYEDDTDMNDLNFNNNTATLINSVIIDTYHMIYPAVINDLDNLKKKIFEEKIIIESKDFDILEFNIFDGKHMNLIAHFTLKFNNKYPFEAPKLNYFGPKYDFLTNLKLTFDFQKTLQTEWSIKESIYTIINEIINLIFQKKIFDENLFWEKEELDMINFLKEINYFKNTSFFEENKNRLDHGKGTGYSKNSESGILGSASGPSRNGSCSLMPSTLPCH